MADNNKRYIKRDEPKPNNVFEQFADELDNFRTIFGGMLAMFKDMGLDDANAQAMLVAFMQMQAKTGSTCPNCGTKID